MNNWIHKYIIRIHYRNRKGEWEVADRDTLYLGPGFADNLGYYALAAYGAVAGTVGSTHFREKIDVEAVRENVKGVINDTSPNACPLVYDSIQTSFNETPSGGNPVIQVWLRNVDFDEGE